MNTLSISCSGNVWSTLLLNASLCFFSVFSLFFLCCFSLFFSVCFPLFFPPVLLLWLSAISPSWAAALRNVSLVWVFWHKNHFQSTKTGAAGTRCLFWVYTDIAKLRFSAADSLWAPRHCRTNLTCLGLFCVFCCKDWVLTVNTRSSVCVGVPCDLLLGFHDLLIKPKLRNRKVSVKPLQNPQNQGWGLCWLRGPMLEPGLGLAEALWRSLCCPGTTDKPGDVFIMRLLWFGVVALSTVSVAQAACVEIRDFLELRFFLFV